MATPHAWQFCKQPHFDSDVHHYKQQPYIDLSNGAGIYEKDTFIEQFPSLAAQYLLKKDASLYDETTQMLKQQATQSFVVYVPENCTLKDSVMIPLFFAHKTALHDIYIILERNATATLSHDLFGDGVYNIACFLQEHAQLTLVQKNRHANNVYSHVVSFGQSTSVFRFYGWYEQSTYAHIETVLQQAHAQAQINIGMIGKGSNTNWVQTLQHHQAPQTESSSCIKALLNDASHAVHLGLIEIDKDAQQVVAEQQSKCMLLDERAQAHAVPSLKVLAHEVQCAHGSAIGHFDQEQLHYMLARGLSEREAMLLLQEAFFDEVRFK